MSLRIIGISLGTIENLFTAELLWNTDINRDEMHIIHTPCWYIEGGEKKILVDTGFKSVDWFDSHIRKNSCAPWQTVRRTPDQELEKALSSIGIKTEDIDIVINTHLHFDHCGQNYKFPNAKFIVQEKEYFAAFMPFTGQESFYANPTAFPNEMPPFWGTNFTFIDGDVEIIEGVNCILLPGHSYGNQGVMVKTKKGDYLISGDHLVVEESWERKIPPGWHISIPEWYESCRKIESLNVIPIAGHDKKYFEKDKFPIFG